MDQEIIQIILSGLSYVLDKTIVFRFWSKSQRQHIFGQQYSDIHVITLFYCLNFICEDVDYNSETNI